MSGRTVGTRLGRVRLRWALPLALAGAVVLLAGLSVVFALPGEHTVKGWLGTHYFAGGCGDVHDRATSPHWRAERPLGQARDELRGVRIGAAAYVLGGAARSGSRIATVRTFERYDLQSGVRRPLAPLPVPVNHAGVATYRGDFYAVGGGGDALERGRRAFWRYSMRDRRWSAMPPMPTPRTALGVAVVGDTLYAIGGKNDLKSSSAVEAYSFRSHRWTRLAPLPWRGDHIQVAAYGGAIYVAGGRNPQQGVQRRFERYDPRSGRWTRLPDLPTQSSGSSLVEVGNRLVVAGGENPPRQYMTARVMAFDPRTATWSDLPAMDRPRHGYAGVGYGDRIYVLGGSRCPGQAVGVRTVDSLAVH